MKFFWLRFSMWSTVILFAIVSALMSDNTLMGVMAGFAFGMHITVSAYIYPKEESIHD